MNKIKLLTKDELKAEVLNVLDNLNANDKFSIIGLQMNCKYNWIDSCNDNKILESKDIKFNLEIIATK